MTERGNVIEQGRAIRETFDSLMKKCPVLEIVTFVCVMFLSPASVVIDLAIGISPEAWLMSYLRYVAVFVTIAIRVALAGLGVATSY